MHELFTQELRVVNVGLASFAENLVKAGGHAVQLAWRPPANGDVATGLRLASLINDPTVEAANRTAFSRYLDAQPVLVDVVLAREAVPALNGERRILHAGPPIAWGRMCGPVQGAIAGAIVYEGWAASPVAAMALAAAGTVALGPAHDHGAVGPMAGIISPSMPGSLIIEASVRPVATSPPAGGRQASWTAWPPALARFSAKLARPTLTTRSS